MTSQPSSTDVYGSGQRTRYGDSIRAVQLGIESRCGQILAPSHTGRSNHPASCTVLGPFLGGKAAEAWS